jgi:SAM-dependent methyltransferase
MALIPDLTSRYLVPELMDDPDLPKADHDLALQGLRRINAWSRTTSHLARVILQFAKKNPQRHWSLLDIGCANGENLISLQKQLSKKISVTSVGWDISPYAIQQAQELSLAHKLSEDQLRFETVDALSLLDSAPQADIVMNSLFMHHFEAESVVELLSQSAKLARVALVADDLHRTSVGWLLAKIGCLVLSRSPVVHFDGPQSVRAAFSIQEISELAHQAGLKQFDIHRHWPERYTLIWHRTTGHP